MEVLQYSLSKPFALKNTNVFNLLLDRATIHPVTDIG